MSKTIEISDYTWNKIKDLVEVDESCDISQISDLIGEKLFLRTVTYHIIGKVKKTIDKILVLSDASWVADSGRFQQAIKNGDLDEVEFVGDWFVNLDSVTDFGVWKHALPTEQK